MEYFRQRFIDELNDEGPVTVRVFEWPSSPCARIVVASEGPFRPGFLT